MNKPLNALNTNRRTTRATQRSPLPFISMHLLKRGFFLSLCLFYSLFYSLSPVLAREKTRIPLQKIPFTLWAERKEWDFKKRALALFGNGEVKTPYFSIYGEKMIVGLAEKKNSSLPVENLYGEKNIFILSPPHFLEGKILFYDFKKDRGILKDGSIHISPTHLPQMVKRLKELGLKMSANLSKKTTKGPPLYLKAKEMVISGLLRGPLSLSAKDATVTTCGLDAPHYHFYASSARLDQYSSDGEQLYKIRLSNFSFRVKDTPLIYLPYFYWDTDWNPFVPMVKVGSSSKFGGMALLKWNLPGLIPGKTSLILDFYKRRGEAQGVIWEYGKINQFWEKGEKLPWWRRFYGKVDGYTLEDKQENREDRSGYIFPDRRRYWTKWLHRQVLPGKIEMTGEYQKFSDEGIQLEYNEREAKEGRGPETYLSFQRNYSSLGATLISRVRQNNFTKEVEELPRVKWFGPALPILPLYRKGLYLDLEGEAGYLKHFDQYRLGADRKVFRLDQKAEISLPLSISHFQLRPFVDGRFSAFSETLDQDRQGERFTLGAGARASLHIFRTFKAGIPFLSIDGLKHTLDPEISYKNIFFNSLSSNHLLAFDEVEQVARGSFFEFNLWNRLFGKRKDAVLRLSEIHFKNRFYPRRKENPEIGNREFGYFFGEGVFYLGDKLQWKPLGASLFDKAAIGVVADYYYHPYRGKFTRWNLGLTIQDEDRYSLILSHRFQEGISEVITLDMGAKLNQKWSVRAVYQYDFRERRLIRQSYLFRRKLHQWYLSFQFESDGALQDNKFSINFAPAFIGKRDERFGFERSISYDSEIKQLPGF